MYKIYGNDKTVFPSKGVPFFYMDSWSWNEISWNVTYACFPEVKSTGYNIGHITALFSRSMEVP